MVEGARPGGRTGVPHRVPTWGKRGSPPLERCREEQVAGHARQSRGGTACGCRGAGCARQLSTETWRPRIPCSRLLGRVVDQCFIYAFFCSEANYPTTVPLQMRITFSLSPSLFEHPLSLFIWLRSVDDILTLPMICAEQSCAATLRYDCNVSIPSAGARDKVTP